jgi:hypothetical protein
MHRPGRIGAMPPLRSVMTSTLRMPEVQRVDESITRNLQETLMDRDALRRVKTGARQTRVCVAPLAQLQKFVTPQGGVNTAPSMAAGAHKMNSRRLVAKTRGQSAGI